MAPSDKRFDTIFLDVDNLRALEILASKEKLIRSDENIVTQKRPDGYRNLLFLLLMYEHWDSSLSNYDLKHFVNEGVVRPDSCIINGYGGGYGGSFKRDEANIKQTKEIASFYKDDLISAIKKRAHKYYSNVDDLFFYNIGERRREVSGEELMLNALFGCAGKYSLTNDFETVVDGLLSGEMVLGLNPKSFSNQRMNTQKEQEEYIKYAYLVDPTDYLFNLLDSIYSSKNHNVTYDSSIFRFQKKQREIIDANSIYLTQIKYISDIQVIPMPETIADVLKFRKDPNLVSFRNVLNDWFKYVDAGEFALADKMRKDLKRANNALEKLDKVKKVGNHPVTICCRLIGTILFDFLAGENIFARTFAYSSTPIEQVVTTYIEDKYKWSLMLKN